LNDLLDLPRRDIVHLLLVIDGALPELVRTGSFVHHMTELCTSGFLNLHVMVEDKHHDCRDEKTNESLSDAAKQLVVAVRADFPQPLNLNPFIYFARSDFHALI
jgi:hypothetical protein